MTFVFAEGMGGNNMSDHDFTLMNIAATDALGRKLPEVAGFRKDKYVGIFYFVSLLFKFHLSGKFSRLDECIKYAITPLAQEMSMYRSVGIKVLVFLINGNTLHHTLLNEELERIVYCGLR